MVAEPPLGCGAAATPADAPEITEIALFEEHLLAALPLDHRLAGKNRSARRLSPTNCWCWLTATVWPTRRWPPAEQSTARLGVGCKAPCRPQPGDAGEPGGGGLWDYSDSGPGRGLARGTRHCSPAAHRAIIQDNSPREPAGFPRPQALRALEKVIRKAVGSALGQGCKSGPPAVQKANKTR